MYTQAAIDAGSEGQKAIYEELVVSLKSELSNRAQKKTEAQSQPIEKSEQLEQHTRQRPELNPSLGIPALNETPEKLAADQMQQVEKERKWNEVREKLPAMARAYDETIKTVKAPAFVAPDELINVELEDSKGNKQVKTFSKAQVRALARKYFSNVHESWLGKERKMGGRI